MYATSQSKHNVKAQPVFLLAGPSHVTHYLSSNFHGKLLPASDCILPRCQRDQSCHCLVSAHANTTHSLSKSWTMRTRCETCDLCCLPQMTTVTVCMPTKAMLGDKDPLTWHWTAWCQAKQVTLHVLVCSCILWLGSSSLWLLLLSRQLCHQPKSGRHKC